MAGGVSAFKNEVPVRTKRKRPGRAFVETVQPVIFIVRLKFSSNTAGVVPDSSEIEALGLLLTAYVNQGQFACKDAAEKNPAIV